MDSFNNSLGLNHPAQHRARSHHGGHRARPAGPAPPVPRPRAGLLARRGHPRAAAAPGDAGHAGGARLHPGAAAVGPAEARHGRPHGEGGTAGGGGAQPPAGDQRGGVSQGGLRYDGGAAAAAVFDAVVCYYAH